MQLRGGEEGGDSDVLQDTELVFCSYRGCAGGSHVQQFMSAPVSTF